MGWCVECRRIVTLVPTLDGDYQCHHGECQAKLVLCENYREANVCNWTVAAKQDRAYCDSCELTEVIPDLSQPQHRARWFQLEAAKRRLLYSLDLLRLPYRRSDAAADPPLRFQFLDQAAASKPVSTGHNNGCITIDFVETDDVEREKSRVAFGEPQRTLIGHFRHEIGHYYWQVLVLGREEESFRDVFGDERSPAYAEAKQQYYERGPLPDWKDEYISAYATMHPWEDFAECFAGFLDMIGLLDTVEANQIQIDEHPQGFSERILTYQRLAVFFNEISRERGLLDLVPEVFTKTVIGKLCYISQLVDRAASSCSV